MLIEFWEVISRKVAKFLRNERKDSRIIKKDRNE